MNILTKGFPLWAIIASLLAWLQPGWFVVAKPAIVPLLGLVMFGMGLTLTTADFRRVLERGWLVPLGLALQFSLMPLLALGLSLTLGLQASLLLGMILLGACPGGTASNVVCYLAKADVALSVTLTCCSTLIGIVLTPLLTQWLAGQSFAVPVVAMLWNMAKIVLLPVIGGMILNQILGPRLKAVNRVFPSISVCIIVLIIAIVVALNADKLASVGLALTATIILHNALGLGAAYGIAKLCGAEQAACRTLAIEVGMQNSGLAVALALKHFSALAALPGALFSIWHNVTGSALASWWATQSQES